ncbi:hypothetical protein Tco_1326363 [Tanacetum coccineum]
MTTLQFADTHNLVEFLSKPAESEGFEQIVDFMNENLIRYALTINPTIYTSCIEQLWATAKVKTVNAEVQLQALVDGKKIIVTEASVRRDLQLNDEEGTDCLPNATIFEELARMSAKTTAWNEFSSTMASAIIYLATDQKFNFSKYIFESMVKNLENVSSKFLMYLRFVQVFLEKQLEGISRRPKRKDTEVPQPSGPTTNVADEVVNEETDDSFERAATTATSLDVEHDRGNINKTQSKATLNKPSSLGTSSGNTLQSGEDSMKLKELMEFCTKLQQRVLDLKNTKTAQAQEITTLKLRVKKLEKKGRSKTNKLKRLYKVGRSAKVISSDEASLGDQEDASKQERKIDDIDKDAEFTLVDETHGRYSDEDMFGVNDLEGDEVIVETEVDHEVVVETKVASKDVNLSVDEVTLAQELAALKSAKPKADKVMLQEPKQGTITTTTAATTVTAASTRPNAKGLVIHEHEQAPTLTVSSQQPS